MSEKATFYALRFRSADELHRKGDIRYVEEDVLYIGQTEECGLRITAHPDYADTCYAVIVKNDDGKSWRIIRQESQADIRVNGMPLELVRNLCQNDLLTFDKTVVQYTVEHGQSPVSQYVQNKPQWGLWIFMGLLTLVIAGVVCYMIKASQKPSKVFKDEIASICKIEADSVLVLSQEDTLEVLLANRTSVGTGFITEDGYFVTARHCVEFWLAYENELCPNLYDIQSPIVRRAIDAEIDNTIRLVARLKITSHDGSKVWYVGSDEFLMDKSRDDLYDCGDFETSYIWRSVVSRYEKQDAELGDVAVAKQKWPYGKGTIRLEKEDVLQAKETDLYGFGYPQNENRQEATFSSNEGKVYQDQQSPEDCFICEKGFDAGFSGCPIFTKDNGKVVVGIVSRSDGRHTLIVPVSQVHHLISKINE